ncbi:unnamed protein product [Clonostachys rhizophaga]|uniref:aldehyde dehydrogenase (NAD(+)) n=1 Tax=Clonostachys rhizophaga TaxID=160324 RepID=A0A9N9W5S2_9HYPO|nr:unnamed protein product [Clonostachys rhizophaga]
MSQTTLSSPLYHHRQKATVMSFLEDGQNEATLLWGGRALGEKGCYIEPALFIDPSPDARILKEEIFGPILVVSRFSSDDEVLKMANDTEFGLAAYVWTKDLGRALRFAQQLEAGTVSVNGAGGVSPDVPMGESGQGLENGKDAMLDWTQSKSVAITS